MITKNGAPQFESSDFAGQTEAKYENRLLREWAESRRCVRCKFMSEKKTGCYRIGASIFSYVDGVEPETFSCAAFEPMSPIEVKE